MTAPSLQKHDGKQHEQAALSSFHDGKRRAGFDVVHSSVAIQSHGPGAPCAVRWSGRARCCQRHAADIAIRAASLPAGYAAARACAVGGGGCRLFERSRALARPSRGARQALAIGGFWLGVCSIIAPMTRVRNSTRWPSSRWAYLPVTYRPQRLPLWPARLSATAAAACGFLPHTVTGRSHSTSRKPEGGVDLELSGTHAPRDTDIYNP